MPNNPELRDPRLWINSNWVFTGLIVGMCLLGALVLVVLYAH